MRGPSAGPPQAGPHPHGGSTGVPAGRGADRPRLAHGFRFQWEAAQQAHVLLYPEGMVRLNQSAGEILRRVDGVATVDEITASLEAAFCTQGLKADVAAFLQLARDKGWIQ